MYKIDYDSVCKIAEAKELLDIVLNEYNSNCSKSFEKDMNKAMDAIEHILNKYEVEI